MKPRETVKKGLYLIPSAFTCANIGLGFYAIVTVLRGFHLAEGGPAADGLGQAALYFDNAALAICWAMVCDTLDGRIARLTKTTTEIGIQFDTIADVVTFGIAPALLVYAWSYGTAFGEDATLNRLGLILSLMYLICGAFRLGRFNVQSSRPRVLIEGMAKVDKKSFVGLPIPAAALLLASIVHFAPLPLNAYEPRLVTLYCVLMLLLVASLGILMVSTLRFPSFKSAGTQRQGARFVILLITALIMLIWLNSRYALFGMASLYVLYGCMTRLASIFRRRARTQPAADAAALTPDIDARESADV